MSRNIIFIGQCRLDIDFDHEGIPHNATAGGQLLTAATLLAQRGHSVRFVCEAGRDVVGDTLVAAMQQVGIDTTSVDRFTEGTTPSALYFADGRQVWYGTYPAEPMSTVWPRIERDDIVVFGGDYTLEPRVHKQTMELLRYAHDLKAVVIYAPLYPTRLSHLVTHAMPAVLDSFEAASLSIVDTETLNALYHTSDIAEAYRAHFSYYDAPVVSAADGMMSIFMPTLRESISPEHTGCISTASLIAAVTESISALGINASEPHDLSSERAAAILKSTSEILCQLN